jgi:HPt (histidine-containing phosphotransfer) domain-containing protein
MSKIDFSYLEVVSDGDKEFVQEFIRTFEFSSYPLVDDMKISLKTNDFQKLGKYAHQLKPSAKMLKLECSESLESLQHEPEKATSELLVMIQDQCEAAISQLKEWERSL